MLSVANKVAVVIPDQHAPLFDVPALNCVLKAIEIIKPDIVINLGDAGENEGSSYFKWKKKQKPPLSYILPAVHQDIKDVNLWFNLLDQTCDKAGVDRRVFTQGNHDQWLDFFAEYYESLEGHGYDNKSAYKIAERGYEWYDYGEYARLGDQLLYHGGHFTNQFHAKAHAINLSANIIYAHSHAYQSFAHPTLDGYVTARCIGFLGAMKKGFMKGRPHSWSHNFSVIYYDSDEIGRVIDYEIKNGITYVNNVVVNGNEGIASCLNNF
jgi:hypothetical protein